MGLKPWARTPSHWPLFLHADLGLIYATHVGLDLSHFTSSHISVQSKGVGVALFSFEHCTDGHDFMNILCHLSVQVAAVGWT